MPLTINKLDVVVLFTDNLETAKSFYRDTLGMPVNFEADDSAGYKLGQVLLLLVPQDGARDLLNDEVVGESHHGVTQQMVAFVDDVDGLYKELSEKGVQFVREPIDREWGLRTAHFRDPDGHMWEIAQPMAKADS